MEHPIIMVSEAPLKQILTNPNATGRVSQLVIDLSPWEITYAHRTAIKSQVLPEFFVDWTEAQLPSLPDMSSSWTMYFDGSKKHRSRCRRSPDIVSARQDEICPADEFPAAIKQ